MTFVQEIPSPLLLSLPLPLPFPFPSPPVYSPSLPLALIYASRPSEVGTLKYS